MLSLLLPQLFWIRTSSDHFIKYVASSSNPARNFTLGLKITVTIWPSPRLLNQLRPCGSIRTHLDHRARLTRSCLTPRVSLYQRAQTLLDHHSFLATIRLNRLRNPVSNAHRP
ncbi:hypothetical protein EDB81DRAFT_411434 [Dactylonectria macrodidyma]|uniref:Uncharacterized protein n=1 Tax=Dactylonectria macrodidyma TaxID=307937 RepID=A0A9P9JAN0_9HYPO|nr:hypothetical protein EDB81DRAFT_411434 [Dactylonectria macrodidyma]